MKNYSIVTITLMLTVLLGTQFCQALSTAQIFSDNMVLQANMEVPVWGLADAGQEVTVEFAGQKKTAKADKNGYWMLKLSALKASKQNSIMTITAGDKKKIIKNVVVGEVWLCSGQSNMDWTINRLKKQYGKPTKIMDEVKNANFPLLRRFQVKKARAWDKPINTISGSWVACTPKTVDSFSGTAFFFGRELLEKLNTPVGLIQSAWGGTPVESWTPREALEQDARGKSYIPLWEKRRSNYNKEEAKNKYKEDLAKWEADKKAAEAAGKKFKKRKPQKWQQKYTDPLKSPHYPSTLYNGMIAPIIPYAIAGAIWYQGENNAGGQAKDYEATFKAMIKDWRAQWGQGDFPFYFVQLANFYRPSTKPSNTGWSIVREAQRKTLELPNTGMAVAIDIGEAKDIHPRNKVDVGKRLSYWALNKKYGKKDVAYSGPLFKSAKTNGKKIVIDFTEIDSGLMVGKKQNVWAPVVEVKEELKQFQIAGKDKKWKWAKAKITPENTVEVWEESITEPIYVRYAIGHNPQGANLYNKKGLPASPFTDKKAK